MIVETSAASAFLRALRSPRLGLAAVFASYLLGCSGTEDAPPTATGGMGNSGAGGASAGGGSDAGASSRAGASGHAGEPNGGGGSLSGGGLAGAGGDAGSAAAGGGTGGTGGSAGTGGVGGSAGAGGIGGTAGAGGTAGTGDMATILPFPGTPITGYRLEWSDEFEGVALDTDKWLYRTDSKHWSTQLPANVTVSGGFLNLHLKKQSSGGKEYTGAGTISKAAFRYGYYEARMQTPPGRGWHSSFWMMKHGGAGDTGTAATSIELDVLENDSVSPRSYSVNVHRWNPLPHVTYGTKGVSVPAGAPALSADFHVYGCEFTPATVKYFLDGSLVQTVDAKQFAHSDVNIWVTSIASFLGGTSSVDDAQLPAVVKADYVRFFVATPAP